MTVTCNTGSQGRLNKVCLSHPVSFPFLFSLQRPLFLYFPGESTNFPGSEPSLSEAGWFGPKQNQPNRQNTRWRGGWGRRGRGGWWRGAGGRGWGRRGYFAGTWKTPGNTRYVVPVSSVLPQILPQTSSQTHGNSRVARMELQKLSVPWKFPETQSAGDDALFSFLFAGKVYAGQLVGQLAQIRDCSGCPRGVLQAVVVRGSLDPMFSLSYLPTYSGLRALRKQDCAARRRF